MTDKGERFCAVGQAFSCDSQIFVHYLSYVWDSGVLGQFCLTARHLHSSYTFNS